MTMVVDTYCKHLQLLFVCNVYRSPNRIDLCENWENHVDVDEEISTTI